jgi:lipopolysaccharide transport system permease protein
MDFALTLFSGLLAFNVFSECATRAPRLIVGNPNYVKKVVFPLEILAVSVVGSAFIHSLISLGLVLVGLLISSGKLHWTLLYLPLVYLPLVAFTLGVSWLLASLGVFVRDVHNFVGVAVQLFFLNGDLLSHFSRASGPAAIVWAQSAGSHCGEFSAGSDLGPAARWALAGWGDPPFRPGDAGGLYVVHENQAGLC